MMKKVKVASANSYYGFSLTVCVYVKKRLPESAHLRKYFNYSKVFGSTTKQALQTCCDHHIFLEIM